MMVGISSCWQKACALSLNMRSSSVSWELGVQEVRQMVDTPAHTHLHTHTCTHTHTQTNKHTRTHAHKPEVHGVRPIVFGGDGEAALGEGEGAPGGGGGTAGCEHTDEVLLRHNAQANPVLKE